MAYLEASDLTIETIQTLFDSAAMPGQLDDDHDLYLHGEGIEFPVWVSLLPGGKRIRIFTMVDLHPALNEGEAHAIANKANSVWQWGCFNVQRKDRKMVLACDHSLLTAFGIDSRMLIGTVRALATTFRTATEPLRKRADVIEEDLDSEPCISAVRH